MYEYNPWKSRSSGDPTYIEAATLNQEFNDRYIRAKIYQKNIRGLVVSGLSINPRNLPQMLVIPGTSHTVGTNVFMYSGIRGELDDSVTFGTVELKYYRPPQ